MHYNDYRFSILNSILILYTIYCQCGSDTVLWRQQEQQAWDTEPAHNKGSQRGEDNHGSSTEPVSHRHTYFTAPSHPSVAAARRGQGEGRGLI